MKTTTIKQTQIAEKWYLIDADGQRIGRIATKAAELLLGKANSLVRSNLDPKVKVVVINSAKLDVTPKRGFAKFYKRYSGYPGGLKHISLEEQMKKNPNFAIENAVKGMLPKNKRGNAIFTSLKVYSDSNHKHDGQKPEKVDLNSINL